MTAEILREHRMLNAWMQVPLGFENFHTRTSALNGVIPRSDAAGYFASGLILTIALNTRSGAFLMLPLIVLWLVFFYKKSLEVFVNNPFLFLPGLFKGFLRFGKDAASFFQIEYQARFILSFLRLACVIFIFFAFKSLKMLTQKYSNEFGLLNICFLGIILFACALWTDGGFRVFAVTVPFSAVMLGTLIVTFFSPLLTPINNSLANRKQDFELNATVGISVLLLFLGIVWPTFIKTYKPAFANSDISHVANFTCAPNENLVVSNRIYGTPHFLIDPASHKNYAGNVLNSSIEEKKELIRILDPDILDKAMILGLVYDLNTKRAYNILGPKELFLGSHKLVGMCAAPISEAKLVLKVSSYGVLNEK